MLHVYLKLPKVTAALNSGPVLQKLTLHVDVCEVGISFTALELFI